MTSPPLKKGPELFFGLVAPLGVDLELVQEVLEEALDSVKYQTRRVHLIELLNEIDQYAETPEQELDRRIDRLQEAGNHFRKKTGLPDALARLALTAIRKEREASDRESAQPIPRCAYILRQLKHPKEAALLRQIYGSGFILVAAYSPKNARLNNLSQRIALSHNSNQAEEFRPAAQALITRDEAEPDNPFGQNVRNTFPLADVFINASDPPSLRSSLRRFIELLFGNTAHTPYREEYCMFHARAAAVRSADLDRQVGAVIATSEGNVIAVGTNEVPKQGGGLYWSGDDPDARDSTQGRDQSGEMKRATLGEVIERLKSNNWLTESKSVEQLQDLVDEALPLMIRTQLMSLGEFGRTVHAEMAALLDAACRGVSVRNSILYTTTYPCHNCTKHIIAAGIRRVIYVEPYPKSLATVLHEDSIVVDPTDVDGKKVAFRPFVGVAPKRYLSVFAMTDRRDSTGKISSWKGEGAMPRYPARNSHLMFFVSEKEAIGGLGVAMGKAGLKPVE